MKILRYKRATLFWKHVNKKGSDECWNWIGAKKKGYGYLKFRCRVYRAHRFSYMINKGEIPKGLKVCHECDNPLCVNPKHLWLGTDNDNAQDKIKKGRQRIGEEVPQSKLSNIEVLKLRYLYRNKDITIVELSSIYKVSYQTMYSILIGKTWKHLSVNFIKKKKIRTK